MEYEVSSDTSGFVKVTDVCPDVILEMRYFSTFNFVGARVDGYEAPIAILTREAAAALANVSNLMIAQGYRLKIWDAYRPQRSVDHFVRWAEDIKDTRMERWFYPGVDKRKLFRLGFIAKHSGHTRGSTVDLTLLSMETGGELDMGGGFDLFSECSHYGAQSLTSESKENRRLLREAMEAGGFEPYDGEWWHFTLREEPYPQTYFDFPVR
ncbi:MAG: M15 family metallopeptidase [Clostridiales bacterium]|nr:M15 family metallopeptidase [Clostridiales bacterium]